jgi:hypothetical protein
MPARQEGLHRAAGRIPPKQSLSYPCRLTRDTPRAGLITQISVMFEFSSRIPAGRGGKAAAIATRCAYNGSEARQRGF